MKKLFSVCLVSLLAMNLTACGGTAGTSSQMQSSASAPTSSSTVEESSATEKTEENSQSEEAEEPLLGIKSEKLHIFTDSIGSTDAIYLCELVNTGSTSIKLSDVSIDVEDEAGTLMTVADYVSVYPEVIAPGEIAYICEEVINGTIDTDLDASKAAKAIVYCDITEKEKDPISAEVTQINLSVKSNYPNVTGKVKNTGSEDLSMVYVSVPVYSAEGELQTVIFTIIDKIKAGEEQSFEQMGMTCDTNMDFSNSTLGEVSVYEPTLF